MEQASVPVFENNLHLFAQEHLDPLYVTAMTTRHSSKLLMNASPASKRHVEDEFSYASAHKRPQGSQLVRNTEK